MLCKKIVRLRHPHNCYTCGLKNLQGSALQTGHMIPKSALDPYMKYDIRVLRPQCVSCNLRREGMGAMFYRNMVKREGKRYVDDIFRDLSVKANPKEYYKKLLEQYKEILKDVQKDI
jgi:hypothetical protein